MQKKLLQKKNKNEYVESIAESVKATLFLFGENMKKRDKYAIVACSMVVVYIIVYFVLLFLDKQLPTDAVSLGWFGLWTAELGYLFGIKLKKESNKKKDNDEYSYDFRNEG